MTLKDWENKLLEIIDGDVQYPVFHKIPEAVSMGIAGKQHLPDDNNTYVPPLPPMPAPRPIPPPPKKTNSTRKKQRRLRN
ncbi:hypothetical protein JTB14_004774 [Gonioctena quinquepunctata]|nr:hypothetical protein JTB14_004774 [Gonioctena quinquepunctata]